MADLRIVLEQALNHFYEFWQYGLEPSLNLKTLSNGAVSIHSNVTIFPSPVPMPRILPQVQSIPVRRRHRSGNGARMRRKVHRAHANDKVDVAVDKVPCNDVSVSLSAANADHSNTDENIEEKCEQEEDSLEQQNLDIPEEALCTLNSLEFFNSNISRSSSSEENLDNRRNQDLDRIRNLISTCNYSLSRSLYQAEYDRSAEMEAFQTSMTDRVSLPM